MPNTKWTRNQKIAVTGIIVTSLLIIAGMFVKINFEIRTIQEEIKDIKIKNAEIENLTAKIAEIDTLKSRIVEIERISGINGSSYMGFDYRGAYVVLRK